MVDDVRRTPATLDRVLGSDALRLRALAILLLLCGIVSCDPAEERSAATAVQVRDSAGVRVVEVPAAALADLPVRRLEAEPRLTVGEVAGADEEIFGYVSDATLLPDGRLAVADGQQNRVLLFDDGGNHVGSFGREGQGPGEFRGLRKLAVSGDTIVTTSVGLISRFLPDGTFVDSRAARHAIGVQMGLEHLRPVGWWAPVLYRKTVEPYPRDIPEGDGPYGIQLFVALADSAGDQVIDSLRIAPGYWVRLTAAEVQTALDQGLEHFPVGNLTRHPLASDVHATFLPSGPVWVSPDRAELRVHDWAGAMTSVWRIDAAGLAEEDDEALTEWVVSFEERRLVPLLRRAWSVLERPEMPARYFDLLAGTDGHLHVALAPFHADGEATLWTRWLRVAPDGMPVEWIEAPPLDWLELGPRGGLVIQIDDLGVHRVAVYASSGISRPAP